LRWPPPRRISAPPPRGGGGSSWRRFPGRRWWAFRRAAAAGHFLATRFAGWPTLYALQCEAFDVVKALLTAAGIRLFTSSPFHRISLREAVIFVLVAVVIVPFLTAFWGAAFTVANNFGSSYWVEWRNLGVALADPRGGMAVLGGRPPSNPSRA